MALSLPEAGFHILPVAIACLNIDLVEGNMQVNCSNISLGLPEDLLHCVEVLSDSIRAGIPESNFFDQVEAKGIVAKRDRDIKTAN